MTAQRTPDTDRPRTLVTVPDRAALATLGYDERRRALDTYVRQELGRLLGIDPHQVDTQAKTMNSLGVGSIAGMELQYRIESTLHVQLNLQRVLLANSAAELIDCLTHQLGPDTVNSPCGFGESV